MTHEKPQPPTNNTAPHSPEEKVAEVISSIKDEKAADLFTVVLLEQLIKLVKNKDVEKINKLIDQYKENASDSVIKKLKEDMYKLVESQQDVLVEDKKDPSTEPEKTKERMPGMIERFGLKPGLVLFNQKAEPALIKKIDVTTDSVDIQLSSGQYLPGCKISSDEALPGQIILTQGKRRHVLSLAEPSFEEHKGLDLDAKPGTISIDVGETITDGKGALWEITKILTHEETVSVELKNESGENVRVYIRDWEKKNNQETLQTLGDQMVLIKTIGARPAVETSTKTQPESILSSVEQKPTPIEKLDLSTTADQGTFTLHTGTSYLDDDKVVWTISDITSLNNKYTISIQNKDGIKKELHAASWDAYPDSIVITDENDAEHLFNPIAKNQPATVEKESDVTSTIPEKIKKEKTGQEKDIPKQEVVTEISPEIVAVSTKEKKMSDEEKLALYEKILEDINRVLQY